MRKGRKREGGELLEKLLTRFLAGLEFPFD